jgi:broad specificity phosphatase PhoE
MTLSELYLCRHGETDWSLSGQHTGWTDKPLNEKGKQQALRLGKRLQSMSFDGVWSSPLARAVDTCELAGLKEKALLLPDAREWNYGDYEGISSPQIFLQNPGWNLFRDGAPGGESPAQIGARADRILEKASSLSGRWILFSHGHFLRVLAARWVGLEPAAAKCFVLSVASLSILGWERKERVIHTWNDQCHLR